MRKIFGIILLLLFAGTGFAQRSAADSIQTLLSKERTDTGRVRKMWSLAGLISVYDPEKALVIAQEALLLATRINYVEGQSKSLGALANTFVKIGNYPRALEFNLRKLQIEEKRNNPASLASTLIATGVVYRYQEQYADALLYYRKADSVINGNELNSLRYFSLMNIGDVYDKLNNTDSAFSYFNKALIQSNLEKDEDHMGNAMTGLGHTYMDMGNYAFSLLNYVTAIGYLKSANNDEVLCEATLGLAQLYQKMNKPDSAVFYASYSHAVAAKDGFLNKQLEATDFLTEHYQRLKLTDSAYFYLSQSKALNDSLNSKDKIRELQVISGNEKLRQLEIEEKKRIAKKERKQQLQLLFIGIFIPGFFLLTLLLSRIRIHVRVIRILGVLSLLILFEYLTLLLHPTVANLTNHTPVYEMLIFVSIAALLIPAHHRIERWLIKKLTHFDDGSIRIKKSRLKVKDPSNPA
ncbi:MAG: tetratricopeptide repeat protein [Chitinophagaceae bacterium]|nr:tetratricopeptide repeat protein [Chitinophagaceae bacterium]